MTEVPQPTIQCPQCRTFIKVSKRIETCPVCGAKLDG